MWSRQSPSFLWVSLGSSLTTTKATLRYGADLMIMPFCYNSSQDLSHCNVNAVGRSHGGLYTLFFAGILSVGFGSSCYHLNPKNATLFWDTFPVSLSYTFCALGLYINGSKFTSFLLLLMFNLLKGEILVRLSR